MPRPTTPILPAALPLALLLLLPAPLPAQESAKEETFFESIDVNVVNVEVYVTGRDGKPVLGLGREDFELFEDGKPVPISHFLAAPAGAAPASAPAPAAAPASAAPGQSPEDQRLYLALFFDNQNTSPLARNQVIDSLEKFVASRLEPGDQLLLASYDGTVEVRQPPTADPAALGAILREIARGSTRGTEAAIDHRRLLSEINSAEAPNLDDIGPQSADLEARATYAALKLYAQTRYDEIRRTLGALETFVDSLAGLPGRKALLLVSGGLSLRPALGLYDVWERKYGIFANQVGASRLDAIQLDVTPLLRRLADRANANRITFYALGAPSGTSSFSAEYTGDPSSSRELEGLEEMDRSQSLIHLTGATGGLAAQQAIQAGPFLDRMRRDLDAYYSLGYVPPHKGDGKLHRIEVKARDRGLKVRHREGYRDRTAAQRTADRTLSALMLGVEDNPLEVAIELGPAERDGKGNWQVETLVKFPLGKLVLLPQEEVHEGRVRIFLAVRDSKGRTSDITEIAVPIRIPNDQLLTALGQTGAYKLNLALRDDRHTVAVGVRDELGNVDSTVRAPYTPGQATAAGGQPGS